MQYEEWNQALGDYFLRGVPRGSKIYLSVDDDVLEYLGQNFECDLIESSWGEDFRVAVRRKVITGSSVKLDRIKDHSSKGLPNCIAFLCATVLAAYHMAEEEEIDQNNYFRRLREILGLPTSESGRPSGMGLGNQAEEPLWIEWKNWLYRQGFLPSAQQGGRSRTYIEYPISQSLLRSADKDRLRHVFQEKQWTAKLDAQTLFSRVRGESSRLTKHLRKLLDDHRPRHQIIAEAIHEVYEYFQEYGLEKVSKINTLGFSRRNLYAGLYRTEDPFLGNIEYYLYPKQSRGLKLEKLQVQHGEIIHTLATDRPGWYVPMLPILASQLDHGVRFRLIDSLHFENLILSQRNFWILISDPEDTETSVFATWGIPDPGTSFILLCKKSLLPQFELLRDEQLIQWKGDPHTITEEWVELQQCMVISDAWSGVLNQELSDALRPRVALSISLSGGLRIPGVGTWLERQGPRVKILGFYPRFNLRILSLSNKQVILERSHETNTDFPIEWDKAGDYLVEASFAGEVTERLVKIIDWKQLQPAISETRESTSLGSWKVCGSLFERTTD